MTLKENLEKASSNIRAAQIRSGIDHPVEIVGVTKTHPFSYIEESFEVGIRSIGENRIQEAQKKFTSFDKLPGLKKRFIGHLQSNKIKKCVDLFDTVDSVHSYKTLKKIFHHSHESKKNISVLLEVNTSGERQKNGFLLSQKDEIIKCFLDKDTMVDGLMTIGPHTSNKKRIRKSFVSLRELKEGLCDENEDIEIKHLSMGMSGDYEIAIEEGSTMVRLGSLLYGVRNQL